MAVAIPAPTKAAGEAQAPPLPPARTRLAKYNEALPTGRQWYILQDPSPAAAPDGARNKEQSALDCWRDRDRRSPGAATRRLWDRSSRLPGAPGRCRCQGTSRIVPTRRTTPAVEAR